MKQLLSRTWVVLQLSVQCDSAFYIRMALLPWMLSVATLQAQPFQCDGAMYVALLDQSAQSCGIFAIRPGPTSGESVVTPVRNDLGIPLHVIGYNVLDNHIYGFNTNNYHFYRIGAAGQWTDLGIPANLDTIQFSYHAGEMSPNGASFLLVARSKTTGFDARFYSIRFQPTGLTAGYVSVISTTPVRLEDIAYDPVFGELVGYDSVARRMVSVNTAGVISEGNFTAGLPVESLGSLFFDRSGRLYGYGGRHNMHNSLLYFNRINGKLEASQGAVIGRSSDGCGCPYQIQFSKTIDPPTVLPCAEVTITYHFRNTAAISYGQIRLTDTLPDFFTITEIVRPPFFGTVQSGIGASVFDASGIQVLLAADSVVLRAALGQTIPGWYDSQASAGPFPTALGGVLRSDNPATPTPADPTGIEIAGNGNLFPEKKLSRCAGLPFTLSTRLSGESFLWSTGATQPIIEVLNPGTYWIQIEGPCGLYRDTILLESVSPNLIANLGPDRTIIPGETLLLEARHSGNTPQFYSWYSYPETAFNCDNCTIQRVQPNEETTFSVIITDQFGCTASDSVIVKIKNEIPIFVPTAFSPDDNGINDMFYPHGPASSATAEFKVYNRWGELVFSQPACLLDVPEHGWDGNISGKPAPAGVYLWILRLRFADNSTQTLQGSVQLLR